MNSCIRCGIRLTHNYLKAVFMTIKEKRRRALVCLKCEEILGAKAKNPAAEQGAKADIKRVNQGNGVGK